MNFKAISLLFSALLLVGTYCQDCAPGDTLCSGVSGTPAPIIPRGSAAIPESVGPLAPIGPKENFGPLPDSALAPLTGPEALAPKATAKAIAPAPEAPITATGTPKLFGQIRDGRNYTDPAYNTVIASQGDLGSSCKNLQPSALQGLMKLDQCLYFRKMINYVNQSYSSDQSQLWRTLLTSNTNATVFCPTNLAIEKWCARTFGADYDIGQCITDPQNGRMVEYMILPGKYSTDDIKNSKPLFESQTYLQNGLAIQWAKCGDITQARMRGFVNSTGTFIQGGVGLAQLLANQTNYEACGTYIHVVDEVLTPCPFTGNAQTRGCGAVWDQVAASVGRNNVTYQQLIQSTKMYQTVMQDVAWVGTAFVPTLNALNKFLGQLKDNGVIQGSSDPAINDIMEQVLELHFTNGSLIYTATNGYATKYTGGGGTTSLAPTAKRQQYNLLVQSLATNFSICPNKIGTNQTYILVQLDPKGAQNAQISDYGYGNITAQVSDPDGQGCSQVVQMIDTVIQPCRIQKSSSTGSTVFGVPGSGSSSSGSSGSSNNQFSSLQSSGGFLIYIQPSIIFSILLTLVATILQ